VRCFFGIVTLSEREPMSNLNPSMVVRQESPQAIIIKS